MNTEIIKADDVIKLASNFLGQRLISRRSELARQEKIVNWLRTWAAKVRITANKKVKNWFFRKLLRMVYSVLRCIFHYAYNVKGKRKIKCLKIVNAMNALNNGNVSPAIGLLEEIWWPAPIFPYDFNNDTSLIEGVTNNWL